MSTVEATAASTPPDEDGPITPRPRGNGPLRVLLLGLVGALLIGSAGYVVSVALETDPPIGAAMCVDSSCTFAMSAGEMPMGADRAPMQHRNKHRSAPERFVRDVLSSLHLR